MAGKPKSKIDVEHLERLARLNCTIDEAAAFFKCTKRTLLRYLDDKKRGPAFREAWERGKQEGRLSLRRLQWRHANGSGSSSVQMTIHLSKHWLGETEKAALELTGKNGGPIETANVGEAREIVAGRIAELAARIGETKNSGGPK